MIAAVGAPAAYPVQQPFVTLLPAYGARERRQAEAVAKELVTLGCVEFCCVGPEAELLHDALDETLEAEGALGVVTTWMEDPAEASEYFVHAAAGKRSSLLGLIHGHPELEAMLRDLARREGRGARD